MLRDSDLYRLFRQCKQLNALPLVHAENGALIEEVSTCLLTYLPHCPALQQSKHSRATL